MKKLITALFISQFFGLSLYAQTSADSTPVSEEAGVGIITANGNLDSQSYLLKNVTGYKFDPYFLKFTGNYFRNKSQDNTTNARTDDENWDLNLRLTRDLNEKLGIFIAQNAESNKPNGIDRRYNSDVGARYYLVRNPTYYTLAELGYRYRTEEYEPTGSKSFNLARAYVESQRNWNPTFSTKLWLEYLPNFDEPDDYNVNGELSLNAALDTTFALQTAYLVKYDNMPVKPHKSDTLFTTSLIAKF